LKRLGLLWTCLGAGCVAAAAQGGPRTLQFSLDRDGPPPVQFTITVNEDGSGTYVGHKTDGSAAAAGQGDDGQKIHIDRPIVTKLFAAVPMVEGGRCETHSKGIAKTGVKTLRYTGLGRDGQCVYNYSDDDRVNDATSDFEALALTMQYGERLAAKLRFDRLGLDGELEGLQTAVSEGRALDVENIAPVLRKILADERVMDRAHTKAQRLLQSVGPAQAGSTSAEAADSSER
jgi:hypothetical protein